MSISLGLYFTMISAVAYSGPLVLRTAPSTALFTSFLWFGLLLAVLGIGAAGVTALRRRLRQPGTESSSGLTIDDLRRHHRQGRLTSEEYENLKRAIISGSETDMPK